MASTNKTDFLRLNSWLGTDKPKRDDFNADNLILDTKIKEHFNSAATHVTQADKQRWDNSAYVVGSYVGNGQNVRLIQLGFAPRFGIVFAVGQVAAAMNINTGISSQYSGMFSQSGGTLGVSIENTSIRVVECIDPTPDNKAAYLNTSNVTYCYIAFR